MFVLIHLEAATSSLATAFRMGLVGVSDCSVLVIVGNACALHDSSDGTVLTEGQDVVQAWHGRLFP